MYTVLPLYTEQVFQYTASLAGKAYSLSFEWNSRVGSLYLSIYDEGNTPLAVGLRLVPGVFPVDFGNEFWKLTCLAATRKAAADSIPLAEIPDNYRLVFFEV